MLQKLLLMLCFSLMLSTPASAFELSGSWLSGGNPNKVCGVLHQGDDRVTIIDEDRYRGYGRVENNILTITNYERPNAANPLAASIEDNGTRLQWPGNAWNRKADTFQIWLLDLICHSQNESGPLKGDDEIYIVRTSGQQATVIGEWHDFDQGKRVKNILLWEGTLTTGQSIDVVFVVMEEDDDKDVFVDALGQALQQLEGEEGVAPILRALGDVLTSLASLASDPDDHIGTFSCHITRKNGGGLSVKWSAKESCKLTGGESREDPQSSTLEINGDDARYELWLYPFDR